MTAPYREPTPELLTYYVDEDGQAFRSMVTLQYLETILKECSSAPASSHHLRRVDRRALASLRDLPPPELKDTRDPYDLVSDPDRYSGHFEQKSLLWYGIRQIAKSLQSQSRINRAGIGFNPAEIIRSGILDCNPCRANDLSNPIHRVFDFANFRGCDFEVYRVMMPAFRLASLFLSHPSCRSHWTTLMFGDRSIDVEKSTRTRTLTFHVEANPLEDGEEVDRYYDRFMNVLSSTIVFEFTDVLWSKGYAATWSQPVHDQFSYASYDPNDDTHPWQSRVYVRLLTDYYTLAKKFAAMKYPDEAARLRFYFGMARVLVHELAHVIESKARATYLKTLRYQLGDRDFFKLLDDPQIKYKWHRESVMYQVTGKVLEAGRDWERAFFGGEINIINRRADAIDGHCVREEDTSKYVGGYPVFYAVPLGYIEECQQQTFWDRRVPRERSPDFFKIPKVGPRSILQASFSTMHLRDHLLHIEADELGLDSIDEFLPNSGQMSGGAFEETQSAGHDQYYEALLGLSHLSLHDPDYANSSSSRSSSGSSEDSPRMPRDPAQKQNLTPADKWLLAEEWFCRAHNETTADFLSRRATRKIGLPDGLDPWRADSWQDDAIDQLLHLRKVTPTPLDWAYNLGDADEFQGRISRKWLWLEELSVYTGNFRYDIYTRRTTHKPNFTQWLQSPEWDPWNNNSWGEAQHKFLSEQKERFWLVAAKWVFLEEYMRLKGLSRDEFLSRKHTGRLGLGGGDARFDPDQPQSWGPAEMAELRQLSYELTPFRKDQKWRYVQHAWTLFGWSYQRQREVMSNDQLKKQYFDLYPDQNPDNPDSWNQELTESLLSRLAAA